MTANTDYKSRNERFKQTSSPNTTPFGSIVLDLPPSCLEFVPLQNDTSEAYFVVGTYDLQKEEGAEEDDIVVVPKEQSRQGSLSLFRLEKDILTKKQSFPTPSAILDLRFYSGSLTFAVASSTGTITIYTIQVSPSATEGQVPEQSYEYSISPGLTHQVLNEDTIITAFAWDDKSNDCPRMAITTNTGDVKLLRFNESFTEVCVLNNSEALRQHSYEAWCAVFSPTGQTIWSGGDDSRLRMARLVPESQSPEDSVVLEALEHPHNFPGHSAGVTAILPLPIASETEKDNILLTGSYDDHIRVYAISHHTNNKHRILSELDIGLQGGGVWRLKFLQNYEIKPNQSPDEVVKFKVLACCMRVGAKILEVRGSRNSDWEIEVLATVGVHESMCYASDVRPILSGIKQGYNEKRVVVSTSFYDRLMFVWEYDPTATNTEQDSTS